MDRKDVSRVRLFNRRRVKSRRSIHEKFALRRMAKADADDAYDLLIEEASRPDADLETVRWYRLQSLNEWRKFCDYSAEICMELSAQFDAESFFRLPVSRVDRGPIVHRLSVLMHRYRQVRDDLVSRKIFDALEVV